MKRTQIVGACFVAFALVAPACTNDEEPVPTTYAGLSADVRVRRDAQGVLHIDGANEADVYYASGYAQALDRYTQMQENRLRAHGRRSEYNAGRLEDDQLIRAVNIARLGQENLERLRLDAPEVLYLVNAWTAGVNRYVAEVRAGALPRPAGLDEAGMPLEDFEDADVFRIGKLYLFGNANQISYDILATVFQRYYPEIFESLPLSKPLFPAFSLPPEERPTTGNVLSGAQIDPGQAWQLPPDAAERFAALGRLLHDQAPGASNNWALDGRHTENGRPIIAGDPHQGLRYPPVFHMQHLRANDGSLDVIGWGFAGTPAIQLGHNRHVLWTATTTYPDWMDIYAVRLSENGIHYAGAEYAIETRTEEFLLPDGSTQTMEYRDVPGVGVMLPDGTAPFPITDGNRQLLLRWTGMAPTTELLGFYRFDHAESLEDMEAAVDELGLGAFNFVFASADGIGYRSSPLLPDRGTPGTFEVPNVVVDGDDPANAWTSTTPVDQLPRSRGGERGWVATANNDPFGYTSDGAVEGDALYFGSFFAPGMRAQRIYDELERLVAAGDVSVTEMQTLQRDTYVDTADILLPELDSAFAALGTDEDLAEYRDDTELAALHQRLGSWDRQMRRDSADALVYQAFLYFSIREVLADELGLLFDTLIGSAEIFAIKFALQALQSAPDLVDQGNAVAVMDALDATRDYLVERFGGIEATRYQWGDVHGIELDSGYGSEFDVAWVPTQGGDGTIDVSPTPFIRNGSVPERVDVGSGAVYRVVGTFDDVGVPQATYTYAGGNALDPASDWFANQWSNWVEGVYTPLHFEEADVAANVAESMTLSP